MAEEDRKAKLPKGYEARAARAEFELEYEKRKQVQPASTAKPA